MHSLARRDVRGRDQGHAAAEQPLEERAQYHRIGNVGDEELIEAQHTGTRGNAPRHELERSLAVLGAAELRMHAAHEAIKMTALARHAPDRGEERVHEQGLAAADAAPQVNALRRLASGARG